MTHYLKHRVFKSQKWIHKSPFYHNQSFHQCVFWTMVVLVPTLYDSNKDLLQITKRMGRISVALMPPLLFLTLRPSPLPDTLYLSLIPIHKWISRVVVVESLLHTVFYLWYMADNNTLFKLKKLANVYGVIAMVLFFLIAITSLKKIRRMHFRFFYFVHYISTWATVILLHFHARPGVPYYTTMNCAILISQIAYRLYHTKLTTITRVEISQSLSLVEFPVEDLSIKPILPGSHIRINKHHKNWLKRWFLFLIPLQHPFTVASLPTDLTVRLVIRNGRFQLVSNEKYYVTGVFNPRLTFMSKPKMPSLRRSTSRFSLLAKFGVRQTPNPFHLNAGPLSLSPLAFNTNVRKVLMCVGGSAISFALPLLRILKFNGVNVRLIWVSRDINDLKLLNHFKFNFDGMQIYISGLSGNENEIEIDYIDSYSDYPDEQHDAMLSSTVASTSYQSQRTDDTPLLSKFSNDRDNSLSKSKGYGTLRRAGSLGCLQCVGEIDPNDEIDFTQAFSARKHKSSKSHENLNFCGVHPSASLTHGNVFRKPSIIEPPTIGHSTLSSKEVTNDGDRVEFEVSDSKLKIPSGIQVFFGRPTLDDSDYAWCLQRECDLESDVDPGCHLKDHANTEVDDLAQVAVIAAGPPGLIETTRRFATDGGLHYHEEAFAV